MQNRQGRVHIRKEELYAILHHVAREEAGRGRESRTTWRSMDSVETILDHGREGGLSLGFPQLADDSRSRPFRTLLLRDGMVGTGELGRGTIAAWVDSVAFDFSTMAGITGPLDRRRHGERRGCSRATGGGVCRSCCRRELDGDAIVLYCVVVEWRVVYCSVGRTAVCTVLYLLYLMIDRPIDRYCTVDSMG